MAGSCRTRVGFTDALPRDISGRVISKEDSMKFQVVSFFLALSVSCASAQVPIEYRHSITMAASVENASPASIDSSATTASFDGFHIS